MVETIQKQTNMALEAYLQDLDETYLSKTRALALFNPELEIAMTPNQKTQFVKVFYHIRGHFHQFLWYLVNFAPDYESKKLIINNIWEEAGGHHQSHEALYETFAAYYGVDIHEEFVEQSSHLDFVKKFNHSHLKWLRKHDWPARFSAYSAYERLDNIDYKELLALAKRMETPKKERLFFEVHTKVAHFETTHEKLLAYWDAHPEKVIEAYDFIYQTQYCVWKNLSDYLYSHAG